MKKKIKYETIRSNNKLREWFNKEGELNEPNPKIKKEEGFRRKD